MKTSVMERKIGKHEHEVVIWNSYEIYAVCKKCGMHDWSQPKDYDGSGDSLINYFKVKYPKNEIQELEV